jgi:hypothetical protein
VPLADVARSLWLRRVALKAFLAVGTMQSQSKHKGHLNALGLASLAGKLNGYVHGAGHDSFRGGHGVPMTPVGVAMTPAGVAMTPLGEAMTPVGVAIVSRAMTPVGVACRLEPMGLARTPVGGAIAPWDLPSQGTKHQQSKGYP